MRFIAKNIVHLLICVALAHVATTPAFADATAPAVGIPDISGEWYDWTKTMQPEKPWRHDYSQTVVMKIHLCDRDGKGNVKKVFLTFEQALEVIRKLDNITLGIPKIVYLVGWQFTGHDSGYPSWSVVNESLKRPQDKNALDSLKWLMAAAKQYHTVVSLHINMNDAYKNSPLWAVYDKNDVVFKDAKGNPIKGGDADGMQAYQLSHAQEWKTGLAQKRIDALLDMLPQLQEAGTIHLDAFGSRQPVRFFEKAIQPDYKQLASPHLGFTLDDEIAAQRKIIRYWRKKGLDVTVEGSVNFAVPDPFIGLVPMAWHYDSNDFKYADWLHKPKNFLALPQSLYTGTPMMAELEIEKDPNQLKGLAQQFCEKVVPWYYVNNTGPKEENFNWTPTFYGEIYAQALWRPSAIVSCAASDVGTNFKYLTLRTRLPQAWKNPSSVKLMRVTVEGLKPIGELPVKDGVVEIPLRPKEATVVENE